MWGPDLYIMEKRNEDGLADARRMGFEVGR